MGRTIAPRCAGNNARACGFCLPVSARPFPAPPAAHRTFRTAPFRPARWLRGAHLQTVGGKVLRPRPDPGLVRTRIETPDGDFLDLDVGPEPTTGAPVVLLLHGLEGSTERAYMRVAMVELLRHGLRPIGMNFRSCSGVPNRHARFYHSGETGDPAFVLEWIASRFPDRPVGALGFSLGGNVLLRYLGEAGAAPPPFLRGAAAISVPFDLTEGTRLLETRRMGRVYARYFLRSLQAKARAKRTLLAPRLDLDRILSARTLRAFDEAATAPLHGFGSALDYYRAASSATVLPDIRVPTLLLHALDDPFLPPEAAPIDAVRSNPWLHGVFLPEGGHVGFVESGTPRAPRFWSEREAARYLAGVLGES